MNIVARAFVLVLALTGAVAAIHPSMVSQPAGSSRVAVKATAFPIPTCPMDDPNGCGITGDPHVAELK